MNFKDVKNLISKWMGRKPSDPEMPEDIKASFRILYRLSQRTLTAYMVEAEELQQKAKAAKTRHKIDLYQRKFNKVKKKFQDELGRLHQVDQIMKENNIEPPKEEEENDK